MDTSGSPLRRFSVTVREVTRYDGWVLAANDQDARDTAQEMVVDGILESGTGQLHNSAEFSVVIHRPKPC